MSDTIIVRCAYCGNSIGEITFVKGSQTIGCDCKGITKVTIYNDGSVETEKHTHPSRN